MLVYGRYIAGAFGPLTMLALYSLFARRDLIGLKSKLTALFGFAAVLIAFGAEVVDHMRGVELRARYFISLNTFTDIEGGYTTVKIGNISSALITAGLLSLVIFMIVLLLDWNKKYLVSCILILGFFVIIFNINFFKIRYSREELLAKRVAVSEEFIRDFTEVSDEFPYLALDDSAANMRIYQVLFREFKVARTSSEVLKDQTDYIIVSEWNEINYDDYEDDYYQFTNYQYREKSRDVVYIKGERLKARLESMGYVFTKMELPEGYEVVSDKEEDE